MLANKTINNPELSNVVVVFYLCGTNNILIKPLVLIMTKMLA